MDWKNFIQKNLINSKSTLYHFVGLKHFLEKRFPGIFDRIILETSFFSLEIFIRERLYCLYYNITERKQCEFCTDFLKFIDFKDGYRETCGKKDCYKKLMKVVQSNGRTRTENRRYTRSTKSKKENIRRVKKQTKTTRVYGKVKKRFLGDYQEIREKISTSLSNINDDNLTGYEQGRLNNGIVKCPVIKYNSTLYFQGRLEKQFLDMINELGLLKFIKNGPTIRYTVQNKNRIYRADFIYCDYLIFEIKSIWTYDSRGMDIEKRIITNSKIKATLENGFEYILMFDKYLVNVTLEKISNIKNNLLDEKRYFDKKSLKKILIS